MIKAVIIEDDKILAQQIRLLLEFESFEVQVYHTAEDFIMRLPLNSSPTLYLLDLGLPGVKGIELVKLIRYKDKVSQIFMISGHNDDREISECFKLGADDYINKPCNPDHLLLKLVNARQRLMNLLESTHTYGLSLLPEGNLVIRDGARVQLTRREFGIMDLLIKNPKDVHSREILINNVCSPEATDRTIDVHIHSLRKKIKKINLEVETCRGLGYKLIIN
ncbi:MAG TPA: response regulator transcription factor [Bacteriovoracaceae bacterium]|nr:response regulator transcription factor [Bacteriovoracaceae bacterium]